MTISQKIQGFEMNGIQGDLYAQYMSKLSDLFVPNVAQKGHKILLGVYQNSFPFFELLLSNKTIKVNSYFFYQRIDGKRIPIKEFADGCSSALLEETLALIETSNEWTKTKTDSARVMAERQLAFALRAFHFVAGITSIHDLTLEQFKAFVKPLRTVDDRWKDDIDAHKQKALRSLAIVADLLGRTSDFSKVTTVQRSDTKGKTLDLFNGKIPHMLSWVSSWSEYLDFKNLYSASNHHDSFSKFKEYLEENYQQDGFIAEPLLYFSKFRNQSFRAWLEEKVESKKMTSQVMFTTLLHNNDYGNWFISQYMSETGDDGDLVSIGYPLVPPHKLDELRSKYSKDSLRFKSSESSKASPPLWMILRLKEILTEDNFAWPKSKTTEYDSRIVDENGNQVWIPTVTYLYLTMLEIPLRKIQVLRLDSGEGDEYRYIPETDKWEPNDHVCACYWKNDPSARVANRGVFRRVMVNGTLTPTFSFYINSNKTADREEGFGETSGYEIPWKNDAVIKLMHDLREWQEKYNPVTYPIKHRDIPESVFDGKHADVVLAAIPDRFYLFRSGKRIKGGNKFMPPTKQMLVQFWNDLIEELERRLHGEGIDVQLVLTRNKQNGSAQKVYYTPHGLRVAGLTSLAEQGVPIEVLSKIVAGHKSILMTMYYIKYHPSHISDVLNEAGRKIESSCQESYALWLKEASWEQVAKYSAYNSEDAITAIRSAGAQAVSGLWNSTNFGICPYAGTRCHDGGRLLRKEKKKDTHASVDDKNCVICRHFITGQPWLNQLWIHANALILKSEKQSALFRKVEGEVLELKQKRMDLMREQQSIPPELLLDIKKADALMEKASKELDVTFNNLHATHNLIEKIKYITALDDENLGEDRKDLPALIIDEASSFKTDYVESPNNFKTLDLVIQASRIYQHERNESFEREREQFIDAILMRNNYEPLMLMRLSEQEKQRSADAIAKFLVTEVKAEDLNLLRDGRRSLEDLGLGDSFSKAAKELDSPLHKMELLAFGG